ncbi:GNAT family N-acetyltransferase [Paenibacillus sp. OAS669]|uniref:GNAT family N-acetyltransferase n=1 Tax=Paenibacillus sp. OAS669 TaxID=2663821 RepID=UPI00178BE1E3|nr:GNAT family N-acetyltransferase [Paenibacillus sp. OAS669]MBE1443658.1 ribosomal protein S18 acetylase RimI-like enzyme [Paenibacillus sp. OAS669]
MIRLAQPADAPAAAALIYQAIKDIGFQLMGADTEQEVLERLTQFFQTEGNRFSYSNLLVKEIDGVVAGMILCYHGSDAETIDRPILEQLRSLKNDPNLSLDKEADEDEYYIDALAVFPEWGGRGIGTELIRAAEEHGRQLGYDKIALNVEQYNEKACALYKKLGYEADKNTVINGHTYFHMVKRL